MGLVGEMEPPVASPHPAPKANIPQMATEKESKKVDPRQERWDKYVAGYQIKNPVKYAAKKARGEFDKIPASFQ